MKKVLSYMLVGVLSFVFIQGVDAAPLFYIKLSCPDSALTNQTVECNVLAMATGEAIDKLSIGISTNDYIDYSNSFLDTAMEVTSSYVEIGTISLKTNDKSGRAKVTISAKPTTSSGTALATKSSSAYIDVKSNVVTLKSLKIDGVNVDKFNKNVTNYDINTTKSKVAILATATSNGASVTGDGNKNLDCGNNSFIIKVVSETNKTKNYTLNINRVCDKNVYLKDIRLSSGALEPEFKKDVTSYTVKVDKKVEKISVTGVKEVESQKITGNVTDKELVYGDNKINITVTSQTGEKQVYTVNVVREDNRDTNAFLSSLSLSSGNIDFDKNTFEYETAVLFDTENIEVLAIPEVESSKVTITGNKDLQVGENIILVKVKSEKDDEKTYTIKVKRLEEGETLGNNANVKSITVRGYKLKFDVNKYDYKLVIDKEKSLDIKVILEDSSASYEIIGNKDLKDGSVIKIVTKALDGKSKTYTITITKNDYTLYYIIAGVLLLLVVTIPVLVYFKSVKGKKKELDVNGYEKGREYEDNTASRTVIGANISSSSNVNVNNGNSVNNNSENVISDGSVGTLNANDNIISDGSVGTLNTNNQNVNQSNDLDSFDGELQDYVPNENSNKCPSCGRELLGNPNECPYCKIRLK